MRDGKGRVVGISKITRDLSERAETEERLRATQAQLQHAQRMEAVGRLAGGIAHDFNNLLSVVLSYASMLTDNLPPGDPSRLDLEEITAAGERAVRLTRQLLAFSRKQVLRPTRVDLGQLTQGMKRMIERVIGEDIDLSFGGGGAAGVAWTGEAGLGAIVADPGQVEQVVMNLVVNARDAMPRGGRLSIESSNVTIDEAEAAARPGLKAGRYVRLTVSDTGVGMDAATRERIFEPFFTTKDPGKGTGLGLSTVFGIVTQSGGFVDVDSVPGAGTTFRIDFPRTDDQVDRSSLFHAEAGTVGGRETILVVDDDEAVQRTTSAVLRRRGYDVVSARNSGEALVLCEKLGRPVDLLLTDVVMPFVDGPELARRLSSAQPSLRVLFLSGHTEDALLGRAGPDGYPAFLQKPVMPATLLRKVREVLDVVVSSARPR